MPFYTFETKDKNIEKKVFLARLTFSEYDQASAGKPRKDGYYKGKYGPIHPDTEKPVKTWRRVLDEVKVQFAQPWESSKWDSFEYRAGYNMVKAQQERRNAEARSHMGASPHIDAEHSYGFDTQNTDIAEHENRID